MRSDRPRALIRKRPDSHEAASQPPETASTRPRARRTLSASGGGCRLRAQRWHAWVIQQWIVFGWWLARPDESEHGPGQALGLAPTMALKLRSRTCANSLLGLRRSLFRLSLWLTISS